MSEPWCDGSAGASPPALRHRLWWHARFFWSALLGYDFESDRVQALVREHFTRFWRASHSQASAGP